MLPRKKVSLDENIVLNLSLEKIKELFNGIVPSPDDKFELILKND
jgi:hypothetical protein